MHVCMLCVVVVEVEGGGGGGGGGGNDPFWILDRREIWEGTGTG